MAAGEEVTDADGTGTAPVAVVVPVLHDAAALARLLDAVVSWSRRPVEIIVVSGAGDPALARLTARYGGRWIEVPANRGAQLDAGARAAAARILWFLHADADVPRDAIERITAAVDAGIESGCLTFSFQGRRSPTKAVLERFVRLRVRLGGVPYGDQALFATAAAYHACGGFAHQPLFEEVRLVRRLRRRGSFRVLPERVGVAARRWERDGWWRRTLHNRWLAICYMLGVPAERLAAAYGRPGKGRPNGKPQGARPETSRPDDSRGPAD